MQIKPTAKMEKRLSDPSRSPRQNLPNHSRKSKRRSSRKNNLVDTALDMWPNNPQNDQDVGLMSGTEYPQMLWQSASVPQNVPGNGQRLFTAMSDPSVCGYSPMPVTYTMQPVSLPGMYRIYQPMAMPNIRASHGRRRHHCNEHLANVQSVTNNTIANGYGSLQENGHLESTVNSAYQNGDYASLPPTANKDSSINSDELNAEHRRYSDPGLGPAENVHHSDSDSESIESGSSITTISCSNKLVLSLIEQMTELKKCNSLLFKELSETKTNLENVKAKLAYCKYNSPTDYQPGMLSELVREIREANKNCEESLTIKVKAIFEERYNHQAREVEELRNQISQVVKEKENSDQRIAKLEEEVTALKLSATNEGREIAAFEEETLALRRELQEARASRTLAENHVAKCVNFAVSRSVSPVTFDTPHITSTPVRTALTDSCSLPPVLPQSAISSATSSSVFCSRSAEVAAARLFVSETTDNCQSSGTSSASREDVPQPIENGKEHYSDTILYQLLRTNNNATNVAVERRNKHENPNSESGDTNKTLWEIPVRRSTDYLLLLNQEKTECSDEKMKSLTIDEKMQTDTLIEPSNDHLPRKYLEVNKKVTTEKNEAKPSLSSSSVLKQQEDSTDKQKPNDVASKEKNSIDHVTRLPGMCDVRTQRGSFKKPRRKKNNLKRSFSETDKSDKNLRQDTRVLNERIPVRPLSLAETGRDMTSEDENSCANDDHTSRSITEVPDVAVVYGGSIVPKDLCSTRPLTSRTQTAPSRATYTTAYI
ncbi:uncharacterized protein LOC109858691 isoform X2 [Pseudomyrmex gracilis]|uniref:uncharacterized protein LOC109858691 isoform X2 n=1 Tax=Pseudomyrmex gracilis TaxID=219809 RepID=UPI0009958931|nr:uncharacterized protein LOC109858691 isoform X2 [Pseudomyrmex gracilis]